MRTTWRELSLSRGPGPEASSNPFDRRRTWAGRAIGSGDTDRPRTRSSTPSTVTVLVIGDETGVREATAHLLRNAGYAVVVVADGLEGLRHILDDAIDVVVLDLRMPGLDGPGLLEAVKNLPPVIVVSAFDHLAESELIFRHGLKVTAVLRKPVAPQRLLEVVAAIVEQGRL